MSSSRRSAILHLHQGSCWKSRRASLISADPTNNNNFDDFDCFARTYLMRTHLGRVHRVCQWSANGKKTTDQTKHILFNENAIGRFFVSGNSDFSGWLLAWLRALLIHWRFSPIYPFHLAASIRHRRQIVINILSRCLWLLFLGQCGSAGFFPAAHHGSSAVMYKYQKYQ